MQQESHLIPGRSPTAHRFINYDYIHLIWELLYADDLVVMAETEDDLIKRCNEWKDTHTQPFYCSSGICLGLPG